MKRALDPGHSLREGNPQAPQACPVATPWPHRRGAESLQWLAESGPHRGRGFKAELLREPGVGEQESRAGRGAGSGFKWRGGSGVWAGHRSN